jgi:hypothetical protein
VVKLGFIVEGQSEKIILERSDFFPMLKALGIDFVPNVINANGNGNLLPKHRESYSRILQDQGATLIIILTDLDEDKCITLTKQRIKPDPVERVFVSVKAIEAWYLADTEAMRSLLVDPSFEAQDMESISLPYEYLRQLAVSKTGRGLPDKAILARRIINSHRFSLPRAAQHPDCHSARYFIQKLKSMA